MPMPPDRRKLPARSGRLVGMLLRAQAALLHALQPQPRRAPWLPNVLASGRLYDAEAARHHGGALPAGEDGMACVGLCLGAKLACAADMAQCSSEEPHEPWRSARPDS